MRTKQQFSIALPKEMPLAVKAKGHTGKNATESKVIRVSRSAYFFGTLEGKEKRECFSSRNS